MSFTFFLYCFFFFFFNDTATTEIYTLSLHDALPISGLASAGGLSKDEATGNVKTAASGDQLQLQALGEWGVMTTPRSEEHTSELQSPCNLVCRLLLEKKKKKQHEYHLATQYTDKTIV